MLLVEVGIFITTALGQLAEKSLPIPEYVKKRTTVMLKADFKSPLSLQRQKQQQQQQQQLISSIQLPFSASAKFPVISTYEYRYAYIQWAAYTTRTKVL